MKTQWRDVSKAVPIHVPPWRQVVNIQYTTFLEYNNMFFSNSDRAADSAIVDRATTATLAEEEVSP